MTDLKPTILGQFSGADQSGDRETVSGADWKTSSTSRHTTGAAAQTSWWSVGVVVVVAAWVKGQVAVDILHTFTVTLKGQQIFNVASRLDVAKKGVFSKYLNIQNLSLQAEEEKQQKTLQFSHFSYLSAQPRRKRNNPWSDCLIYCSM